MIIVAALAAGLFQQVDSGNLDAFVHGLTHVVYREGGTGHGNQSFPSGEVTEVSAIVTPFVLEYGRDHPGIYALELLPVYDGIARMKVQAHWQTDVLAGFALGTGTAWLVQRSPSSPFILRFMPHGVYVGIGKSW